LTAFAENSAPHNFFKEMLNELSSEKQSISIECDRRMTEQIDEKMRSDLAVLFFDNLPVQAHKDLLIARCDACPALGSN
jgi:hypothetical protein